MVVSSHFHPITVHFPIALLLLGLIVEVLSLANRDNKFYAQSSLYLLLLGSLGCVAAYLTGEFLTEEMFGKAGDVRDSHALFANITTFGSLFTAGLYLYYHYQKSIILRWVVFGCYCLVGVAIVITGYYGGTLVYEHMIK